jgi:Protein of unknown function (DUF429)
MRTEHRGSGAAYLGVDLSDRYAKKVRPLWVCGIEVEEGLAKARFWRWRWPAPGEPLDVTPLLPELKPARLVLIDGPQGLARSGQDQRRAEALARTPAPTADHLPELGKPQAGLIRSSVELFAALYGAGIRVSPSGLRFGVSETYPSSFWALFKGLPKKSTKAGVATRRVILDALGLRLDEQKALSQGHCDAALAALTAAAADGALRGAHAVSRGDLVTRGTDGLLREGPIVELKLNGWREEDCRVALEGATGKARERLGGVVSRPKDAPLAKAEAPGNPGKDGLASGTTVSDPASSPSASSRKPILQKSGAVAGALLPAAGPTRAPGVDAAPPESFPILEDAAARARAEELLGSLAARASRGRPGLITYRTAWLLLFPEAGRDTRFGPEQVREVLRAAIHTGRVSIEDAGDFAAVALDTFIVDSVRERPGDGHWTSAPYTRQDWLTRFGTAEMLPPQSLRLSRKAPSKAEGQ